MRYLYFTFKEDLFVVGLLFRLKMHFILKEDIHPLFKIKTLVSLTASVQFSEVYELLKTHFPS